MKLSLIITTILWFSVTLFAPIEPGTQVQPVLMPEGTQFYIPALVLLLALWYEKLAYMGIWKALNSRLWLWLGFVVLGYIALAWFLNAGLGVHVPTLGSFNTEGVLLLLFMNVVFMLRGKLGDARSWFLAVSAMFFLIGIWESLYQVLVWASWYHQWFPAHTMLHNEIYGFRPHPLMGVPFLVLVVYYAKMSGIRWVWWTLVPLFVFVEFWTIWYMSGYWVIWYADHNVEPVVWVYNRPIQWVWYLGARGSKAVMATGMLLFLSGLGVRGLVNREWVWRVASVMGIILLIYLIFRPR